MNARNLPAEAHRPTLAEAGITDFKAFVRLGGGHDQTVEELTPLVDAFRAAVGRT